jgi:hypothetical protein
MTSEARLVTKEQLAAALRMIPNGPFDDHLHGASAGLLADAIFAALPAAAPAEGLLVERLRAAIAYAGYEFRDPCDACGGVPDSREPDVLCAWCGGINGRLIRAALARHESAREGT